MRKGARRCFAGNDGRTPTIQNRRGSALKPRAVQLALGELRFTRGKRRDFGFGNRRPAQKNRDNRDKTLFLHEDLGLSAFS